MNMKYHSLLHIELSRVLGYNLSLTQSVHFGRFVSENKFSNILSSYHAQRLENTASIVQEY